MEQYKRFIEMLRLRNLRLGYTAIAKAMGMSGNADKYLLGLKKCFLTHMRAEHERIGVPRQDFKWLPLRLKPRGTPDEAWVEVPPAIRSFQDIQQVIQQLSPTSETFSVMEQFRYKSEQELLVDRTNLFGFLLGVTLGDAGKPVKGDSRFPSMALSLTLSKDKPNSLRFGEFTALSAHTSLGLTMHRIMDAPSSQQRYTRAECYRWITPATPLIGWIFRVCLGLEKGKRTTYDAVKMDWSMDTPRSFKVHFLQGLAESDGWVDAGSDKVAMASSPNEQFLSKLLESLGVPSNVYKQQPITRVEIDTTLGLALPIFNERLHSNNYQNLVVMATAKRFPPREHLPSSFLAQIEPIVATSTNYSEACLNIAKATGYKVSSDTVKKYFPNFRSH